MKPMFNTTRWYTLLMVVGLIAFLVTACGKGQMFGEDPKRQKYKDRTLAYLPDLKPGILKAQLAHINRDTFPDLVLLRTGERGEPVIRVWINKDGEKFDPVQRVG